MEKIILLFFQFLIFKKEKRKLSENDEIERKLSIDHIMKTKNDDICFDEFSSQEAFNEDGISL